MTQLVSVWCISVKNKGNHDFCNYNTCLTQPRYFSKAATVCKSQRHQDQNPSLTKAEDMQKTVHLVSKFIHSITRGNKILETGISKNRSTWVQLYIGYDKQQLSLSLHHTQEQPFYHFLLCSLLNSHHSQASLITAWILVATVPLKL